jgi:hypothetical protein
MDSEAKGGVKVPRWMNDERLARKLQVELERKRRPTNLRVDGPLILSPYKASEWKGERTLRCPESL